MITRQANPILRHIREMEGEGGLTRLSDRQLPERCTANADYAIFETLERWQGPMVLRVCRSVLRDEHAADALSLMPNGFLGTLRDEQVRDLIGYLMSRSQVPLPKGE